MFSEVKQTFGKFSKNNTLASQPEDKWERIVSRATFLRCRPRLHFPPVSPKATLSSGVAQGYTFRLRTSVSGLCRGQAMMDRPVELSHCCSAFHSVKEKIFLQLSV